MLGAAGRRDAAAIGATCLTCRTGSLPRRPRSWRVVLSCRRAEDRHASVRELAKAEGVNHTYIGRLVNLTLLAPDLVEAVLDGRSSQGLGLHELLERSEAAWAVQRVSPLGA